jgi:Zn-dependent protease with chaperone function/uncharacterized tellurite resistance protein B-like protein
MTDFFRQQELARGRTRNLVILFALAVLVVIGLTYFLSGLVTLWGNNVWAPNLLLSAGIAGSIIGLGSGVKMLQLSAGGAAVARDLGGRELDHATKDPDERKLLNIVEEMSIASGIPVPQVWVMDEEDGINAFAAGRSTSDAVIGVTRGSIKALTRDELQGVIAHEFSHILNGDMRLNLRLIGVVHGILIIAIIGGGIFRVAARMRGSGKNNPQVPLLLLGAALYAIGYAGVLLGRMIKSAVSRQREFLADASAVQFTRNPQGIGGALKKIGGSASGSKMTALRAEEASHMMFGNVVKHAASLFATHPPLEERIRAILPEWDGQFEPVEIPDIKAAPRGDRQPQPARSAPWGAAMLAATPQEVVDRVGMLSPADMENAALLRDSIPEDLRLLLHEPSGAQAVMFGLLISPGEGTEADTLSAMIDSQTLQTAKNVAALVASWHSIHAITLIDVAIPALRHLTPEEYKRFSGILEALVQSDQQIDLFEFMVQRMLRRHLDRWFHKSPPAPMKYRSFQQLIPAVETLLTAMSGVGARTPEQATSALQAGQTILSQHGIHLTLQPRPASLEEVSNALDNFDAATPLVKKQLLMACVAVAKGDGDIASGEAELLRAVADTIGCPMPPLLTV